MRLPPLTAAALAALALWPETAGAFAQPPAAAATPAPAKAAGADDGAEDRVFALVQAGKCAEAKAAAERADDANLAGQIGLMCGAKPNGASSSRGGGGRRGGGARGGGAPRGGGA